MYCDSKGINVYMSQSNEMNKQAIVERLNRTLKGMISKWRTAHQDDGNRNWVAELPNFIRNYNTTRHGTMKETPEDIWYG